MHHRTDLASFAKIRSNSHKRLRLAYCFLHMITIGRTYSSNHHIQIRKNTAGRPYQSYYYLIGVPFCSYLYHHIRLPMEDWKSERHSLEPYLDQDRTELRLKVESLQLASIPESVHTFQL